MNILCPNGLHVGVFQGLDGSLCRHHFIVPRKETPVDVHDGWDVGARTKPSNVISKVLDWNGDYDCILVQSAQDWCNLPNQIRNSKPIIYYELMNGRGTKAGFEPIYTHKNTILGFVSNSCRISHGIFDEPHFTLFPGVNEDDWNAQKLNLVSHDIPQIVHARNDFAIRDTKKYADFLQVVDGLDYRILGRGGNANFVSFQEQAETFIRSRLYLNIEIYCSTFSIAAMEGMMASLPIVSNDIEGSADFIRNGTNGFVNTNLSKLRNHCIALLNDKPMADKLGEKARETAIQAFGKHQFNEAVNYVFDNLKGYQK
jgi:glycosyltransferase involved in cell wall biosynthesis